MFSANLRELALYHARAWTDVDDMVRVFHSIPNLESFVYRSMYEPDSGYMYDTTPSQRHPLRVVPMNCLRTFDILDCNFAESITILCYLALPPYADIRIDCSGTWVIPQGQDLTQLFHLMDLGSRTLQQHFESALLSEYKPYTAVEINNGCVSPVFFEGGDGNDGRQLPRDLCLYAPFMPLHGSTQHTRGILSRPEPCLLTALQPVFLQATYLRLCGINSHKWVALWDNLFRYDKVAELHLACGNVRRFATYLDSREYREGRLPKLFPLLEIITLSSFDFRTKGDRDVPVVEVLGAAISRTHGASDSFQRVYVSISCRGQIHAIERLRSHLGKQRVEGISQG